LEVTPERYTLDDPPTGFAAFVALAHELGARQVHTAEISVSDGNQKVVLFFSHTEFPDARFAYAAKATGEDDHEALWLAEELATGALHRVMSGSVPAPDVAGITCLRLEGQLLRAVDRSDIESWRSI
jgi:hypothetical protein